MFDTLSRGFRNARLKLQGKTELSEGDITDALRDVRVSLLEADVSLDVAKEFLDRVKVRSLGQVVTLKSKNAPFQVTPADHFIKSCYDELEALMGPVDNALALDAKPAIIMMVGLQGSGKTTTAGKLAKRLLGQGKKPMLVAADVYRPAAIDQLVTLGRKLNVPVFSIKGMDPVQLCTLAVTQARNVGRDVVIFDTAGRLAIDETLMRELEQIRDKTQPHNILFVCDAMIGQDAVRTAAEFDRRLSFSGFVLTKLDGDARGGAAVSIKAVTGKPVKFLGMGESLDKLEDFRPQGLASRILGFGDVVGLMSDFEKVIDKDKAEKDAEKMLQGHFTYDDFQAQLKMIKQMGSLKEVMGKLPFMDEVMSQVPEEALDDYELVKVEAVMQSMTNQERRNPDLLTDGRFRRIAKGSGRPLKEVQELHERFKMTRAMMKEVGTMTGMLGGGMNPRALQQKMAQYAQQAGMAGMPGMPALPGPNAMQLTKAQIEARRKKAKDAKKARKKQRR
ncbi:MAG: signal recognition particle protein [Deltaproteobacteria bacterium]|nr:signal recognition particle protein [Deltaproteobacteria bacterium]